MNKKTNVNILAFDLGTSGVKTCLFNIGSEVKLIASSLHSYSLNVLPCGGAEQDPDEWWAAIKAGCADILGFSKIKASDIDGVSFCSQMQALVLVNKEGKAIRPAMSYMDQRAIAEMKAGIQTGLRIGGLSLLKTIRALRITGALAGSVKDPVWKYNWVKKNEPEIYKQIYKWLDVKEYIISRMTGRFVMSHDSAFATELLDIRKNKWSFSPAICKMYGVNPSHLPDIIASSDLAGTILPELAGELGLACGTAVFGGGGDATLIGVGAGASKTGDTHVYSGTSGWVGTVTDKSIVDLSAMMAAIVGAEPGLFIYFAELETAGKCLEWVKDHLALDEINIYLEKTVITEDKESKYNSLYDYLSKVIVSIPPGSNGVIFTPWLHGNRMPFENPNARGMFFNISLETGKTELIRSVIEGVCFHLRWLIETQNKKLKTSNPIRFVGGGALSLVSCQILADCTGLVVETVSNPQNVGAVGAAILAAKGLGLIKSVSEANKLVKASQVFYPNFEAKKQYDKNFKVFTKLHSSNKKHFASLNHQLTKEGLKNE